MWAAGGQWSILRPRLALARNPSSLGENSGFEGAEVGFRVGVFVAVVDGLRDGFRAYAFDSRGFEVAGGAEGVEGRGAHGRSSGIGIPLSPCPKPYRTGR